MTKDMTKGPVFSTLVRFIIPLVLGNLLQLTYNAIDSMIVGQYVGKNALAAVGTGNPLMTLVLLFTNGICLGAGVLVSYYYGAGREEILKRQTSTGMIAGAVFSVAVGAVFVVFAEPVLSLLRVDPGIMEESVRYLRIIMTGLLFSFVYNYLASILRAMGDSRSPLYFLAVSAGLNIAGDLFFVLILKMGTAGAAVSTVICEGLSAVLCWIYTSRKIPVLRLGRGWLVFDRTLLGRTVSYGIVSALQQSTVQLGKLCTQAMVNTLGVTVTAAFNATNRFDDYAIVPEQNIAHGMTSVMAQNVGAGQRKRVDRTFFCGFWLEIGYGIIMGALLYLFSNPIMRLFTPDAEVVAEGEVYLHIMAFLYVMPAFTNCLQGYFRGIGDLKVTLVSSIINMGVRVLTGWIFIFRLHWGFEAVPWSYMWGWIAMTGFELPFLIFFRRHGRSKFGKLDGTHS